MIVAVGRPVAAATTAMTNWLHGLSGTNAIALAGIAVSAVCLVVLKSLLRRTTVAEAGAAPRSASRTALA